MKKNSKKRKHKNNTGGVVEKCFDSPYNSPTMCVPKRRDRSMETSNKITETSISLLLLKTGPLQELMMHLMHSAKQNTYPK